MNEELDAEIVCATYTHARRHPMVIGQIAGWTPPFQLTLTQLAVLIVTFVVEMQTWRFWGPYLPRLVAALIAFGLPVGLAWIVRRTRIEGRSLPRFAAGLLSYAATPRYGRVGGRAYHPSRSWWPASRYVYVARGEEAR